MARRRQPIKPRRYRDRTIGRSIFGHVIPPACAGAFAPLVAIVYDLALDQAPKERSRHGCVRSRRFPYFLPLVSRPAGRSRTGAQIDRQRGARGVRRQSPAMARLRTDRRGAGRAQAASDGFDRGPRSPPGGRGISDLSEVDVGAIPIASTTMACSFTARSTSTATMPRRASRSSSATMNSSTRRWRCSSPSIPGQWADLGGYIHALMYLARGHGLDTCAQESWARMHRIVGSFVNMPPEQMLFCAVSIGYGDRIHPANSFRSPRARYIRA